jgi:hypothetical protein
VELWTTNSLKIKGYRGINVLLCGERVSHKTRSPIRSALGLIVFIDQRLAVTLGVASGNRFESDESEDSAFVS